MKIFRNKKIEIINKLNPKNGDMTTKINERPRICCFDIDNKDLELLKHSGFNIYNGTLGNKIKVPNTKIHDNHQLLLKFDFPTNLNEYDIIIVDLENNKIIDYKPEDHNRKIHTGKTAFSLLCSYPETIFDPRPLSSYLLNSKLRQIGERKHIIITFTTSSFEVEYETVEITEYSSNRQNVEKYNIYSFLGFPPLSDSKYGKEMVVCKIREDFKNLLDINLSKMNYNQTFHHPRKWEKNGHIPNPSFIPLVENSSGDIVSICESRDNSIIFYFPQIKEKGEFLITFLTKIAPEIFPELFPFSTTFSWKNNEEYWLPNHKELLKDKTKFEKEYEEKMKLKNNDISQNIEKYAFLHNLLTETGDKLVDAIIEFLKWLGFEHVKKFDDANTNSTLLEEDIQIQLSNGLLIIECKGIGGTSTDSDCNQISKIKHRRCKERNNFDVYALYIVNHQRYLPPLSRQNPPFSEIQIQDAINDERGLLTTWQLFNLYYDIENGILEKQIACNALLKFGFIEFRPSNISLIDEPKEFFKEGSICIINITNVELSIGEEVLIEKNGKFTKSIIEGIQVNDKPVTRADTGEIGLQLSVSIKKKSKLWKKANM